jgi:hypothetical protein
LDQVVGGKVQDATLKKFLMLWSIYTIFTVWKKSLIEVVYIIQAFEQNSLVQNLCASNSVKSKFNKKMAYLLMIDRPVPFSRLFNTPIDMSLEPWLGTVAT